MNKLLQHILKLEGYADNQSVPKAQKGKQVKSKLGENVIVDGKKMNTYSDEYENAYKKGIGQWVSYNKASGEWDKLPSNLPNSAYKNAEFISGVNDLPEVTVSAKMNPNVVAARNKAKQQAGSYEDYVKREQSTVPRWAGAMGFDNKEADKQIYDRDYNNILNTRSYQNLVDAIPQGENESRIDYMNRFDQVAGKNSVARAKASNVTEPFEPGNLNKLGQWGWKGLNHIGAGTEALFTSNPSNFISAIQKGIDRGNQPVSGMTADEAKQVGIMQPFETADDLAYRYGFRPALMAGDNLMDPAGKQARAFNSRNLGASDTDKMFTSFLNPLNYITGSEILSGGRNLTKATRLGEGLETAGKFLTEQTPLKNVYKSYSNNSGILRNTPTNTEQTLNEITRPKLTIEKGNVLKNELEKKNIITQSEIDNMNKRELAWLDNPEYTKRRIAATGETSEQVQSDINKLKQNFANTDVKSVSSKELDKRIYGQYRRESNPSKFDKFLFREKYQKPQILLNEDISRLQGLGTYDHELGHALSQYSTRAPYKGYPSVKLGNPIERNFKQEFKYLNDPAEQQVRFQRILKFIEDKQGIPRGTKLSLDDINTFADSINKGGKYAEEFSNSYGDVRDLFFAASKKYGKNKQTRNVLLNALNKSYVVPGAVGAAGVLGAQQKAEGGPIVDPRGQWAHPGKITRIPGSDITMKGVNYPVMGIGNNGMTQVMQPGGEYDFRDADYVDEYPIKRPTLKDIMAIKPKPKKRYEPSKGVKNLKAILSGIDLSTLPAIETPIGFIANRTAGLVNAVGDAYTSARYAMDGQWKNAGIDAGEAVLDLIPFAKGKRTFNLAKGSNLPSIYNKLSAGDKAINTGLKVAKAAAYADDFQDALYTPPKKEGGGYVVTRSSDRKGKTHKVTGPDGTVKYFGDSKLGQHPNDPERKKAFYARHKKNLAGNPYFRAFARKTWAEGGQTDDDREMLSGVADILRRINDTNNRKEVANYMMDNFREEDVSFQPNAFLKSANVFGKGGGITKYQDVGQVNEAMSYPSAYHKDFVTGRSVVNSPSAQNVVGKNWNCPAGYTKYSNGDGTFSCLPTNPYPGTKTDVARAGMTKVQNDIQYNQPVPILATKEKGGEMIHRADGSYSRRGLWDNIRANKGSGKKPTKQMLEQERKIRSKQEGGEDVAMPQTLEELLNPTRRGSASFGFGFNNEKFGTNYGYSGSDNLKNGTHSLNVSLPAFMKTGSLDISGAYSPGKSYGANLTGMAPANFIKKGAMMNFSGGYEKDVSPGMRNVAPSYNMAAGFKIPTKVGNFTINASYRK